MISRRTLLGAGVGAIALTGLGATTGWAGSGVAWNQLQAKMQGSLVLPGDANYATAKQLYEQQFDVINPQAIAYCVNSADVATSLGFAQSNGLPFAIRSGGHSTGGYSTSTGLVIDVSGLNAITVGNGTVTVGTGAEGVDVINALSPQGLAVVGGYCPTVAVGGFYQGGGLGLLTRSLGMGCDRVTSASVVLAGGRTVTASPTQNSDLYWAIRGGGGGNFGVVTSYTLTPATVSQVAVINLAWSWDQAATALDGYARWSVDAPRTIGGAAFVQLPDAAPGNTPSVSAFVASTGTTAELESEVARLVSLTGTPVQQTPTAVLPYQALMMNFFGCSTDTVDQCHRADTYPGGVLTRPAFGLQRSRMFTALPPASMWASLASTFDTTARLAGQGHRLEVIPLGGAVTDLSRTDTAFVHRDSLFTVNVITDIESPDSADTAGKAAGTQFVDSGFSIIDPPSAKETYQNFIDPELTDWAQSYYAENYARLTAVKAEYDPKNAFRFAQSIA